MPLLQRADQINAQVSRTPEMSRAQAAISSGSHGFPLRIAESPRPAAALIFTRTFHRSFHTSLSGLKTVFSRFLLLEENSLACSEESMAVVSLQ